MPSEAGPFRQDSVFGAASDAGHGGVNRILAGTPRQSVIAADSIRLLAPKVGPGWRPSERQSNRIPQPLRHRLEAGQHRVDAGCGDSVDERLR